MQASEVFSLTPAAIRLELEQRGVKETSTPDGRWWVLMLGPDVLACRRRGENPGPYLQRALERVIRGQQVLPTHDAT
jgi:hypothetical protein